MSAGSFIRSFYELDNGNIARIRVQPETELFTDGTTVNDAPAGPATVPVAARARKSRREYGIGARFVSFAWDDGQAPTGYDPNVTLTIPIMTPAAYNSYNIGDTATYLGGTGEIVGKTAESLR